MKKKKKMMRNCQINKVIKHFLYMDSWILSMTQLKDIRSINVTFKHAWNFELQKKKKKIRPSIEWYLNCFFLYFIFDQLWVGVYYDYLNTFNFKDEDHFYNELTVHTRICNNNQLVLSLSCTSNPRARAPTSASFIFFSFLFKEIL